MKRLLIAVLLVSLLPQGAPAAPAPDDGPATRVHGKVWHVEVLFTEEGAKLLGEITTQNLERRIAAGVMAQYAPDSN